MTQYEQGADINQITQSAKFMIEKLFSKKSKPVLNSLINEIKIKEIEDILIKQYQNGADIDQLHESKEFMISKSLSLNNPKIKSHILETIESIYQLKANNFDLDEKTANALFENKLEGLNSTQNKKYNK